MNILKRLMHNKNAGIAIEFGLLFPIYITLIFMIIDLILAFIQWSDIQRANGMMSEIIKNRHNSIVASGKDGTWTTQSDYQQIYCSFLILSSLCKNITFIIVHSLNDNDRTLPDYDAGYFCYSTVNKCNSSAIYNNPFQNSNETITIITWAETYRIINIKYVGDYYFSKTAESTSIISLND